ncbi:MAG: very short patch repair endonuclease [Ferruginibacter sp.]
MADVHTREQRSYNMAQIKSVNTKPEILVRSSLHAKGYRYRLHVKTLPGKPDIVLSKYHAVIFVHGCFWHGHANCKYFKVPQTRTQWWLDKINRNRSLDKKNIKALKKLGWKVIVIYECHLKSKYLDRTIEKIIQKLKYNYNDDRNT